MELSKKALKDLRKVLMKDIGIKTINKMSDDDLNQIGNLLLSILAESLKMKKNEKNRN